MGCGASKDTDVVVPFRESRDDDEVPRLPKPPSVKRQQTVHRIVVKESSKDASPPAAVVPVVPAPVAPPVSNQAPDTPDEPQVQVVVPRPLQVSKSEPVRRFSLEEIEDLDAKDLHDAKPQPRHYFPEKPAMWDSADENDNGSFWKGKKSGSAGVESKESMFPKLAVGPAARATKSPETTALPVIRQKMAPADLAVTALDQRNMRNEFDRIIKSQTLANDYRQKMLNASHSF